MITPQQHRDRIDAAVAQCRPRPLERRSLPDAGSLALAADLHSRWPVPLFDNSAMDGYAVRASDATVDAVLRVVADVPAGSGEDPRIGPGEAARIMTGAPMPADADAIVPLEDTTAGVEISATPPASITVTRAPAQGAHVRRAGEDAAAGSLTLAAGTTLGPWELAAAASAGHGDVDVVLPPRVAVVSTGSELVSPGVVPRRGQIPESNALMLGACVRQAGGVLAWTGTVADDEVALEELVARLAPQVDVVVFSGGASVGSFDVVKAVTQRHGVDFHKVSMQPGKPQGFGVMDGGALAFCLPGNPVSAAVSWELFVRPAVRALGGHAVTERPRRTCLLYTSDAADE